MNEEENAECEVQDENSSYDEEDPGLGRGSPCGHGVHWRLVYLCAFIALVLSCQGFLRSRGLSPDTSMEDEGRMNFISQAAGANVFFHSPTLEFLGESPALIQNPPTVVMSPFREELVAGSCWAFEGSVGRITVELPEPVSLESFAYRHISSDKNPNPAAPSAPRIIQVTGYVTADDYPMSGCVFGQFYFDPQAADGGAQYYDFYADCPAVRFVEFAVVANHGADYTCLYRLRLLGEPISKS
uniref:SUN domain-containing protein n=1 Tax=Steinernema glaseri TaxID=37863 RepID=A0A1I7Z677_9BILA